MHIRLAARVKTMRAPVLWRLVAQGCRAGRGLGKDKARWNARLGYALRRGSRLDESTTAYLAALATNADEDLASLVANVEQAGIPHDVPPGWYYNLGLTLRRRGLLEPAATLVNAACKDSENPRWFDMLADIEQRRGNLALSAAARQRVIDLSGTQNPSARAKLAAVLYQAGQWSQAYDLLTVNLEEHPDHATSHRKRASAARMLSRWGGTFTGTLADRHDARLSLDAEFTRRATSEAAASFARSVELRPRRTEWRATYAEMLAADDRIQDAIEQYGIALTALENSSGRWTLDVKQKWQFHLERMHHALGASRVEDPLFACTTSPSDTTTTGEYDAPGVFQARFGYTGLTINGFLARSAAEAVDIFLDGALIRTLNVSRDGHFPRFTITLKRPTVALLPHRAVLEVRTTEGEQLIGPGGTQRIEVTTPHGDGQLSVVLAAGGKIDKKGALSPSATETAARQESYLEIYSKIRDFFDQHLGRCVFLMYGTLLGHYREGDFIPGDDDFDAGYVSDKTDPKSVKEETFDVIVALVRAGFTVCFNRRGRLFRVQLEAGPTNGLHIDLRPLWFQGGNLWVHNHVCLPATRDDFLPVVEGKLRGERVYAPRDTEAFLRGHYGPGWKVPDPGFTYYASEVDPAVRRNLDRALITVREYRELIARIDRECANVPGAGRFVSIGSQDLYPLEDFIR